MSRRLLRALQTLVIGTYDTVTSGKKWHALSSRIPVATPMTQTSSEEPQINCPGPKAEEYILKMPMVLDLSTHDFSFLAAKSQECAAALVSKAKVVGILTDGFVEVRSFQCPSGKHLHIEASLAGVMSDA